MKYSFCKNLLYVRCSGNRILPSFKYVDFLQNHGFMSVAIRYLSVNASPENSFTISYLINSCGLSPESALDVSKRVHFETPQNADSVISFFKNHGFSQTQITNLIKGAPELLVYDPEKTLLPKFQFFYSRGVSSSNLAKFLSSSPVVLRYSLERRIIRNFNFIKDVTLCDDDKVLKAYQLNPRVLQNDLQSHAAPNIVVLRECGVPESNIVSKLVKYPVVFCATPEKFKRIVEEAKKLGFNPSNIDFLVVLDGLFQMSKSTWERKLNVLKECGWSDEEIISAFGKRPRFMLCSGHKIKALMDFYVNTIGLKPSDIAKCPRLLQLSLDKRIIPRWVVIEELLSKGLIKKGIKISPLLLSTENKFLQRFVTPYEDPHLLKLYEEKQGISR